MSISAIKEALPSYAKDLKLNLSTLAGEDALNQQQLWGTFLASAMASRNAFVIREIAQEAKGNLSAEAYDAALAANAIMAMNNTYYKFNGWMADYRDMPAKLRMNVIGNPGVDKADFELWAMAVSVINGCKFCVNAHEKQLIDHGMDKLQVQTAIRIASVVRAAAIAIEGAMALEGEGAVGEPVAA